MSGISLIVAALLAVLPAIGQGGEPHRWTLEDAGTGIVFTPSETMLPCEDHIEMSGEQMSVVLRWGVGKDRSFHCERSLVFPMLRTVPNNTHASLMHRMGVDIPSLVSVNGYSLRNEQVESVRLDGCLEVVGTFAFGRSGTAPSVRMKRRIFPSVCAPLLGETYELENLGNRPATVFVPAFSQVFTTPADQGVTGSYVIRGDVFGAGTFRLAPGETLRFGACFQAYREGEDMLRPDLDAEWSVRRAYLDEVDGNLVLETPDPVLDREFRFAKIRASESIYKTAGGYMHGPGGESYYAAIWANDQAEYVNPFFPFLGYGKGNESAMNAYRHFARFMNPGYTPIPSSIIAEGTDIWNGAGDRGDAAMIAHGAARYALECGNREEAEELWPLIEWCLEYCHRKRNAAGVVRSDSDELEGRFPAGEANLSTSTLYYDGLLSAAMLSRSLGLRASEARRYEARAHRLAKAIESYFGAEVQGFHTYRYYDGNEVLRSWICLPLIVGLTERTEGTIAALTSDKLMTENGLLTQQGSETFWDRSTLYALRGMYIAGDTGTAGDFLHRYSARRLLGDHVPYPIEAWPEGSQRHLSAESGLYARVVTEGMFGIRPTGFRSFRLTPRLAAAWPRMALRHIRAFGGDFDICVRRLDGNKLEVRVLDHCQARSGRWVLSDGGGLDIDLDRLPDDEPFHWEALPEGLVLKEGATTLGEFRIPALPGITHREKAERLDERTFRIDCAFTATKDLDSTRLEAGFVHLSSCPFWMIPSVSYNGNEWGRGKEPKGAREGGEWRTTAARRTSIPGAMYSEGERYAVATWTEPPHEDRMNYSVSIRPEQEQVGHHYIWPEEEMPLTYVSRDRFETGYRKRASLRKGESVRLSLYVHVTPVQGGHAAMRSFLDKAWELAPKPDVEVFPPEKVWELGVRYAKESLWAEEGDYKGFSIGLLPEPDGTWKQRGGGKFEIGWCGQNASYAITLLQDYLRNGSRESLEKGMATLDTWSRCTLPNGLFTVRYDEPDGPIDACNLGTAAVNFFEAYDVAKECGYERPEYERVAYGICDFVVKDQQENGCYAKGWQPDGTCIYREGTIGCFLVPAMIEAYRRSDNDSYLKSARRAYDYYMAELREQGFTTAGALDTWCIDKESSISLLRSALRFHRLTGEKTFLEDAVAVSYYLSTWLWHYDGAYPEDDIFSQYGLHTFGFTSVSVQHNHLDPYALYWVPEWVELSELTGDRQWLEKARAIWRGGNQLLSDGTLRVNGLLRPAGSQNEAYFECGWGLGPAGAYNREGGRINDWLVAWPGAFRLETLRHLDNWTIL